MTSTRRNTLWSLHNHYDTCETELAQEDEGYESGSEHLNIPTPISRALRIYYFSEVEDLSFNLVNFGQSPTTPEHNEECSPHRHRWCRHRSHHLVFTSSDDESPVRPSEQCSPHASTNVIDPTHRRADFSPSVHHNLYYPITTDCFLTEAWVDDTSSEEHFPTVPLDDGIWAEEPIPEIPVHP